MNTVAHGKDSNWESSQRTVSHGRDPRLEQGKNVSSPPHEEEGAAETACDKVTPTPVPCPVVGEEAEKIGSEVGPEKKGGMGGRHFKI